MVLVIGYGSLWGVGDEKWIGSHVKAVSYFDLGSNYTVVLICDILLNCTIRICAVHLKAITSFYDV